MKDIVNIVPHDMFSEYTYRTANLGPRPVLVNLMRSKSISLQDGNYLVPDRKPPIFPISSLRDNFNPQNT